MKKPAFESLHNSLSLEPHLSQKLIELTWYIVSLSGTRVSNKKNVSSECNVTCGLYRILYLLVTVLYFLCYFIENTVHFVPLINRRKIQYLIKDNVFMDSISQHQFILKYPGTYALMYQSRYVTGFEKNPG